ncbi:hypothetical protein EOPP23_02455 [Endozoicomonas sp. OPT23]|uniref:YybH family protein n=1 Tax=Endozoicomonas sp. OPT23 TaxID=2072845 RepID=UPI00129A30C2|nr:nuclear transport factor 2 family protein [Endozoicomonas sp. OPT23]MRI31857.1 hypothetical protein [Endozoicomonas sp. OPT23]
MVSKEIEAFFEQHKKYFEKRNIQGVMTHHLDASLFWDQSGESMKGRNEIRGWFTMMFGLWEISKVDYEIAMLRTNDKMATCALFWSLEGHEEGEPEVTKTVQLKVTYCLEKSELGWKIWHAHCSEVS